MAEGSLRKSALHDRHIAAGARMGEEAGWAVPLSYGGALDEVAETRRRAGVFDVSHYGRLRVRGDGALDLLDRLCTADVVHQEDDTTLETLLCTEKGGVIDVVRLIRLSGFWVVVTSPLCREKVLAYLQTCAADFDAKVDDQTDKTSLLAVAGPETPKILDAVLPFQVGHLAAGAVKFGSILIARYIAERISAGGLWTARVSVPMMMAGQAWRFITEKAGENAVPPAGMLAWDILRLEAGQPRYGYELNEMIDPITAGLEAAVNFNHDFIGAEALRKIQATGPARRRVGLVLEAPSGADRPVVPAMGTPVMDADGNEIGAVTSATLSPTLEKVIAMAYVSSAHCESGKRVQLPCGNTIIAAEIASLPMVGR